MNKIIYLTPGCFDKGGISRYSRYQISAIREIFENRNCKFMSLLGNDSESFEENFNVDYSGKNNSRWEQIKFALYFIFLALKIRPSYIHVAHVNFSGLAFLISKLINAKTILNVYGLELWSGMSKDATWGLKNVDFIISDCYNTKDYLVNNNIRKSQDITVIWDCVDLEKFKNNTLNIETIKQKYAINSGNKFTILTLGRIAKEASHKGYHRLIETFSKLNQEKFYLVLAGKGNMVDELKRIVKEKGIEKNVCFTGMVSEEDMPSLYSFPSVFSLVSEIGKGKGEGIPLTPLEAMACGTPIIVGNQDGSKEAVFNNENGFVVEPFDLDYHKEILEKLESDRNSLNSLSLNARKVAENHFAYKIFLEKHLEFYKKIGY